MKRVVRYRMLGISGKMSVELRVIFDSDRNQPYQETTMNGNVYSSININPFVQLSIIHKSDQVGSNNNWNPSDHLILTRNSIGTFIHHLNKIMTDFEIPNLYTYRGSKLELNDKEAEKVRRAFMCGTTAVELTPTVIIKEEDKYVEGLKIKFNNEDSVTLLEIDELRSLHYTLTSTDTHQLASSLYNMYIHGAIKSSTPITTPIQPLPKPVIDIPF